MGDLADGGKVALLAVAVDDDGAQNREGPARLANSLLGSEFRASVGTGRLRRVVLRQFVIGEGARLRRDRRNEYEMLAEPRCCVRQCLGRAMVDDNIEGLGSISMRDSGQMHDCLALLE